MEAETLLSKNPLFEPSVNCKTKWLRTRKKAHKDGNITFPGLFSSDEDKIKLDTLMSILLVFFELLGLAAIAFTSWGDSKPFKIGGALLLVVIDYMLAIYCRHFDDKICKLGNEIKILNYEYENELKNKPNPAKERAIEKCEIEKKQFENKGKWFLIGLLFISLVKIVCYLYDVKGGDGGIGFEGYLFNKFFILKIAPILYVIIAFLHYYFFSYYYNYFSFMKTLKNEIKIHKQTYKKYLDDTNDGNPTSENEIDFRKNDYQLPFRLTTKIQSILEVNKISKVDSKQNDLNSYSISEIRDGQMNLTYVDTNSEVLSDEGLLYQFDGNGVLTDNELFMLATTGREKKSEIDFLCRYGIKLQLIIAGKDPSRKKSIVKQTVN